MSENQHNRTPAECAQSQRDAYNARNIDDFAAVYAENIVLIALPSGEVFCNGINELRTRYGNMFASRPNLHCRLMSRIVCDPVVIDEEDVSGLSDDGNVHAVATYECRDGRIVRAWFIKQEQKK